MGEIDAFRPFDTSRSACYRPPMNRRWGIIGFTLLALGLGACGHDRSRVTGYSGLKTQSRANYLLGRPSSATDIRAFDELRTLLVGDSWLAIDSKDQPIRGTGLRFSVLNNAADRFYFDLTLNGVAIRGEVQRVRSTDNGNLNGIVQLPEQLAGSQIHGRVESSDIGAILYFTFDCLECNLWGFDRTEWDFQPKAVVQARIKEENSDSEE